MKPLMYRLASFVVALNASFGLYWAIVGVWGQRPAEPLALHLLVRATVLALAAYAHLFVFSRASLCTLTLTMAGIQLGDFAIGIGTREAMRIAPHLFLTVLTLACAILIATEQVLPRSGLHARRVVDRVQIQSTRWRSQSCAEW